MKKYLINFLICFALFIWSLPVYAVSQEQVTKQESEVQSTINEISELDKQINNLQITINDLNQKIEQTSQDLIKAQEEEKELTELSNNRIRVAYMYGTGGYIDYLFSGEEPSDFISHYDITKDILQADRDSLTELENKRKEIETLQANQISQRDQSVNSKNQAEALKAEKDKTLNANKQVLELLKNSLAESAKINENVQVPVTNVTPEVQNNVQATQSIPTIYTEYLLGNQPAVEGTESVVMQEITESQTVEIEQSDDASAASVAPRWLQGINGEESIVYEEVEQGASQGGSNQGMTSSPQSSNPYILAIPNTAGGITNIPSEEFPSIWYWPLDSAVDGSFTITSLIGSRESPGGIGSTDHGGIDIGAPYGTAIIAAASGTVEIANSYGGYGNAVMINHGNGLETLYGHMSSIAVTQGTEVQAGQIIGFVGSTGWSTGPHLHFEVRYTDNSGVESKLNGLSLYGQDIIDRLTYAL